ncbi:hypothetical protein [Enhygromyxa salina]|uniref:Uncharacterized protein n=1 Tax=Enhygromyxa salina TaxID=215803 RepID=A0A2S9YVD5_9BACT|nr:hypothetical protein [Enhygromyxa salina]PRQ09071.1 hypothetical protein ENSA7_10610 [Enhygromyxa salina]
MPGSQDKQEPLMLTDRPWSELETLPVDVRLSGAYRSMPSARDLVVSPERPLTLAPRRVILPSPLTHQSLPGADPKLINCGFLEPNAPPVNKLRQAPATAGDKKKISVGKSSFDNDRDSYFVPTRKIRAGHRTIQLHALVLGWNHAALMLDTPDGYVVHRIYCYATEGEGHKAFGLVDELVKLPSAGDPIVDDTRGTWRVVKPPALVLERLVTYGVSSCSFAALYSVPKPDIIAVSHMSGKPPIPVGLMMEPFLDEEDKLQLVVSHLPQSNELMKFDQDVIFSEELQCNTLLMSRGKVPTRDQGTRLFPQMGHADVGICFPDKGLPRIEGTLGVGGDYDYWTLLPLEISKRLRAAVFPAGLTKNVLFSVGDAIAKRPTSGIPRPELIDLFAEQGHTLPRLCTVSVTRANQAWSIAAGRRTYEVVLTNGSLVFSCASEPFDLGADVVQPLLDGAFGFQRIHKEMFKELSTQLARLTVTYKSKGYFESKSTMDDYLDAVISDYRYTKNEQRAFARLVGGLMVFTAREHPLAKDAARVMKKNRYNISIELKKIDRL